MNVINPEIEIRKIFKKSVRMLSVREGQLSTAQDLLKKIVVKISHVLQRDDVEVTNLLNAMESSVDSASLELLDKQIDDLFMLFESSGMQHNLDIKNKFYICLLSSLEDFKWSKHAEDYIPMVKGLANKELSDEKTSIQLLKIINKVSYLSKERQSDKENKNIDLLIEKLTDGTGFEYEKNDDNSSQVLNDLSLQLTKYIYSIKNKDSSEIYDNHSDSDDSGNSVILALVDVINGLFLPSDSNKEQQIALLKKLNDPDDTELLCSDVVKETIELVNHSFNTMQQETDDLQIFIAKINKQLFDIKSFINLTQDDRKESAVRSSDLQDSVDVSIGLIQDEVSMTNDIDDVKKGISVHLKNIRKQVEENKNIEQEKEQTSVESYSNIINELNSTQDELTHIKSQLKETKSQLLRDPLTGLYNRVAYEERVNLELHRYKRSGEPLCIAMWDIDKFKNVNDTYGHDVGDRILKAFSDLIQKRVRNTDMFARIGGEEFVLLMPETPLKLALSLCDELREAFSKCKFHYNDESFYITSSVGISDYSDNDTASEFLKKADVCLYKSKEQGRNRCTTYKNEV